MIMYQGKYPIPALAEYVLDYVCGARCYYQLVRIKDDAILGSYGDFRTAVDDCMARGIESTQIAII